MNDKGVPIKAFGVELEPEPEPPKELPSRGWLGDIANTLVRIPTVALPEHLGRSLEGIAPEVGQSLVETSKRMEERFPISKERAEGTFREGVLGGVESFGPSFAAPLLGALAGTLVAPGPGTAAGFGVGMAATIPSFYEAQKNRMLAQAEEEAVAQGKDPVAAREQAKPWAHLSGLIEGGGELVGDLAAIYTLGMGKVLFKGMKPGAKTLANFLKPNLLRAASDMPFEAGTEALQNIGEEWTAEQAGLEHGDYLKGGITGALGGATMAALLGGVGHGVNILKQKAITDALQNNVPTDFTGQTFQNAINVRTKMAEIVANEMAKQEEIGPESATLWKQYADTAIRRNEPIDMNLALNKVDLEIALGIEDTQETLGEEDEYLQSSLIPKNIWGKMKQEEMIKEGFFTAGKAGVSPDLWASDKQKALAPAPQTVESEIRATMADIKARFGKTTADDVVQRVFGEAIPMRGEVPVRAMPGELFKSDKAKNVVAQIDEAIRTGQSVPQLIYDAYVNEGGTLGRRITPSTKEPVVPVGQKIDLDVTPKPEEKKKKEQPKIEQQGVAEAASKVHTLEVAGSSPAPATKIAEPKKSKKEIALANLAKAHEKQAAKKAAKAPSETVQQLAAQRKAEKQAKAAKAEKVKPTVKGKPFEPIVEEPFVEPKGAEVIELKGKKVKAAPAPVEVKPVKKEPSKADKDIKVWVATKLRDPKKVQYAKDYDDYLLGKKEKPTPPADMKKSTLQSVHTFLEGKRRVKHDYKVVDGKVTRTAVPKTASEVGKTKAEIEKEKAPPAPVPKKEEKAVTTKPQRFNVGDKVVVHVKGLKNPGTVREVLENGDVKVDIVGGKVPQIHSAENVKKISGKKPTMAETKEKVVSIKKKEKVKLEETKGTEVPDMDDIEWENLWNEVSRITNAPLDKPFVHGLQQKEADEILQHLKKLIFSTKQRPVIDIDRHIDYPDVNEAYAENVRQQFKSRKMSEPVIIAVDKEIPTRWYMSVSEGFEKLLVVDIEKAKELITKEFKRAASMPIEETEETTATVTLPQEIEKPDLVAEMGLEKAPYVGVKPGTVEWSEVWQRNKGLQKEMLRYREILNALPTKENLLARAKSLGIFKPVAKIFSPEIAEELSMDLAYLEIKLKGQAPMKATDIVDFGFAEKKTKGELPRAEEIKLINAFLKKWGNKIGTKEEQEEASLEFKKWLEGTKPPERDRKRYISLSKKPNWAWTEEDKSFMEKYRTSKRHMFYAPGLPWDDYSNGLLPMEHSDEIEKAVDKLIASKESDRVFVTEEPIVEGKRKWTPAAGASESEWHKWVRYTRELLIEYANGFANYEDFIRDYNGAFGIPTTLYEINKKLKMKLDELGWTLEDIERLPKSFFNVISVPYYDNDLIQYAFEGLSNEEIMKRLEKDEFYRDFSDKEKLALLGDIRAMENEDFVSEEMAVINERLQETLSRLITDTKADITTEKNISESEWAIIEEMRKGTYKAPKMPAGRVFANVEEEMAYTTAMKQYTARIRSEKLSEAEAQRVAEHRAWDSFRFIYKAGLKSGSFQFEFPDLIEDDEYVKPSDMLLKSMQYLGRDNRVVLGKHFIGDATTAGIRDLYDSHRNLYLATMAMPHNEFFDAKRFFNLVKKGGDGHLAFREMQQKAAATKKESLSEPLVINTLEGRIDVGREGIYKGQKLENLSAFDFESAKGMLEDKDKELRVDEIRATAEAKKLNIKRLRKQIKDAKEFIAAVQTKTLQEKGFRPTVATIHYLATLQELFGNTFEDITYRTHPVAYPTAEEPQRITLEPWKERLARQALKEYESQKKYWEHVKYVGTQEELPFKYPTKVTEDDLIKYRMGGKELYPVKAFKGKKVIPHARTGEIARYRLTTKEIDVQGAIEGKTVGGKLTVEVPWQSIEQVPKAVQKYGGIMMKSKAGKHFLLTYEPGYKMGDYKLVPIEAMEESAKGGYLATEVNKGKEQVVFQYVQNPKTFGVNRPLFIVVHGESGSDVSYNPEIHEVVNEHEMIEAVGRVSAEKGLQTVYAPSGRNNQLRKAQGLPPMKDVYTGLKSTDIFPDDVAVGAAGRVDKRIVDIFKQFNNLLGITPKIRFVDTATVLDNQDQFPEFLVEAAKDSFLAQAVEVDGKYYILVSARLGNYLSYDNPLGMGTLSHEYGHVIMLDQFYEASMETQNAVYDAHKEWIAKTENMTWGEFKKEISYPFKRYHLEKEYENADDNARARDVLGQEKWDYYRDFREWFADQVSKWATTNEKPMSIVDKFFAKIADLIRDFVNILKQNYSYGVGADYSVVDFLDNLMDREASYRRNQTMNEKRMKISKIGDLPSDVEWHTKELKRDVPAQLFATDLETLANAPEKKGFWNNLKDLYARKVIMPTKDLGFMQKHLSNPFWLGQKYLEIASAVDIEMKRDKNRIFLIHDFLRDVEGFMHLKGDSLVKVEKALIEGDRELPARYMKLLRSKEVKDALELKKLNKYTDRELKSRFKMNDQEIEAYNQVREMLDQLHGRWLNQVQRRAFELYKNQRWFQVLTAILDEKPDQETTEYWQQKLGMLWKVEQDAIAAAKVPLQELLITPKDLKRIDIKAMSILDNAVARVINGQDLTEEEAQKIVESAIKRATNVLKKKEPTDLPVLIKNMVRQYMNHYNKAKKTIEDIRGKLRDIYKMQGEKELDDKELNQDIRDLLAAYGKTKPRLQKLRSLRNQLNMAIAYFPRERDDRKLHYLAVFERKTDEKTGKEYEGRMLYINYFDILSIGGKNVEADMKKRLAEMGLTEDKVIIRADRNKKSTESTFFKVSDANTQKIIQNALDGLTFGSKISKEHAEKINDILLQAVSDELNMRGFGKHRIRRYLSFDEDNTLRPILGYKETDLQNVLFNYITGYAGLETKGIASFQFNELMSSKGFNKRNPNLFNYVKAYAEDQLRNQERNDRTNGFIRSMMFMWYLGANLKAPFVQLTQNFITGIPFLAQAIRVYRKGKDQKTAMFEAEKRYFGAMKDIAMSGKIFELRRQLAIAEKKNDQKLVKQLQAQIKTTKSPLDEHEQNFIMQLMDSGVAMDQYIQEVTGQIARSWNSSFDKSVRFLAKPFSAMEIFNRKSAGLAMYRFIKDQNLGEDSYKAGIKSLAGEMAQLYIYKTHYLMGKANLPHAMRGGDFTPQALRGLYTFRSFTHNYILSLLYGEAEEGITGMEKARTALHSLAYMALLGGLLSLPFLRDLFDWWEKEHGEDILADTRQMLREFGGPSMERAGLYGLVGLIIGDISGSLKIGVPFMGDPAETVYGATGGIMTKGIRGLEAFNKGDYYRGIENLSPEFLANAMRSLRMSQEGKDILGTPGYATTTKGRPLFDENGEPIKLQGWDVAMKMIGFQPTGYSEAMEEERSTKAVEKYFEEKRHNIIERYRISKIKGDSGGMADAMNRMREFNIERAEKGVTGIVAPMKASGMAKSARQGTTRKERREMAYKQLTY